MDFKDFRDGLLSLSLTLFFFSIAFIICSILLMPYITLMEQDLYAIVISCIINLIFCLYWIFESLRLDKVFKLYDKYIIKLGKRIGIITILYCPHIVFVVSLFFRDLPDIELMILFLILCIELLTVGVIFKEVYDLIFEDEELRKSMLEEYRKRYIEKKEKIIPEDF